MATDETDAGQDGSRLIAGPLTRRIIGEFFAVYNELGFGFLESVYQEALARALRTAGFAVAREVDLRVFFRGLAVGSFRADLIVNDMVIIEVKACERVVDAHRAQLLNYLRATRLEVGVLVNFGPSPDFKRVLLTNDRKMIRVDPSPSVSSV